MDQSDQVSSIDLSKIALQCFRKKGMVDIIQMVYLNNPL